MKSLEGKTKVLIIMIRPRDPNVGLEIKTLSIMVASASAVVYNERVDDKMIAAELNPT